MVMAYPLRMPVIELVVACTGLPAGLVRWSRPASQGDLVVALDIAPLAAEARRWGSSCRWRRRGACATAAVEGALHQLMG